MPSPEGDGRLIVEVVQSVSSVSGLEIVLTVDTIMARDL